MSKLAFALAWAARGFPVFPLTPGGKKPVHSDGWPDMATTDPASITSMWTDPVTRMSLDYNIGVKCNDFVLVDVDVKFGKNGHHNYVSLGGNYDTLVVKTPSGGFHCYFAGPDSGNSPIAPDVDIRSHNGYGIAPGSYLVDIPGEQVGGWYELAVDKPVQWVPLAVERLLSDPYERRQGDVSDAIDSAASIEAGIRYLQSTDPAIQGQRGDETTFIVAARLVRELALSVDTAYALMVEHYNPRCVPAWSLDELRGKVENAAAYGSATMGRLDPSVLFATVQVEAPPTIFAQSGVGFGNAVEAYAIPARPWMVDRLLMLHQTTLMIAPGSAGKSSVSLAIAAHLALGRDFGPYKTHTRCKSIVYNGEDDIPEQSRRLLAVCHAYGFDYNEVRQNIMLLSAVETDLKLVLRSGQQSVANEAVVQQLAQMASDPEIGMVVYDPLVDLFEGDESDNGHMNFVMRTIQRVAHMSNTASLVPAHSGKASGQRQEDRVGNMDIIRGASGIVYKARVALTLMNATEQDAEDYGLQSTERTSWVRMDDAKMQYSLASSAPTWFHKEGVKIASGDVVGVLKLAELKKDTMHIRIRIAEILIGTMEANNTATMTITNAIAVVKHQEPLYGNKTDVDVKQRLVGMFAMAVEIRGRTVQIIREGEGQKATQVVVLR